MRQVRPCGKEGRTFEIAPFRRVVLSYENSAHAHAYDTPNDASFSSPKSQPLSRGTREQQMIARMEVVRPVKIHHLAPFVLAHVRGLVFLLCTPLSCIRA